MGILTVSTCQREMFELDRLSTEVELEPQLVAPLIHGSLSMTDVTELFEDIEYIDQFPDSLIYFAYSDTVV